MKPGGPLSTLGPLGVPVKAPNGGPQSPPAPAPAPSETGISDEAYGESPTQTICPHCSKAITTTVRFKKSCLGIGACLSSFLFLGWIGFCLGPFLWVALRDTVHECPHCRNLLSRRSRVSCPLGERSRILTLRCGSCAVVLTRRYFVCFTALFTVVLLCHLFRGGFLDSTLNYLSKGEPTSLTWLDFVSLCGQRSQLGNPLRAANNFRDHFELRTVQWEGLVKQIKEGLFSVSPAFLFVAMAPTLSTGKLRSEPAHTADARGDPSGAGEGDLSELEKLRREEEGMQGDGADLGLAFNGELASQIAKLSPGDKISFQATLHELGRRGKPTVGRLWAIRLVEPWAQREQRLRKAAAAAEESLAASLFPNLLLGGGAGSMLMGLGGPFGGIPLPSPILGRGVVFIRSRTIAGDGKVLEEKVWRGGDETQGPLLLHRSQEQQQGESKQGVHNGAGGMGVMSLLQELLQQQHQEERAEAGGGQAEFPLQRLFAMHASVFEEEGEDDEEDEGEEPDEVTPEGIDEETGEDSPYALPPRHYGSHAQEDPRAAALEKQQQQQQQVPQQQKQQQQKQQQQKPPTQKEQQQRPQQKDQHQKLQQQEPQQQGQRHQKQQQKQQPASSATPAQQQGQKQGQRQSQHQQRHTPSPPQQQQQQRPAPPASQQEQHLPPSHQEQQVPLPPQQQQQQAPLPPQQQQQQQHQQQTQPPLQQQQQPQEQEKQAPPPPRQHQQQQARLPPQQQQQQEVPAPPLEQQQHQQQQQPQQQGPPQHASHP